MKTLLVVLLFALASIAVADVSLTGVFSGAFSGPRGTAAECYLDSSSYPYQLFNVSFTSAGVRELIVASQSSSSAIYIYRTAFDATKACINAQQFPTGNFYSSSYRTFADDVAIFSVHDAFYFEADLYWIVVSAGTSVTATTNGFGIAINEPNGMAFVDTDTAPTWSAPYYSSGNVLQRTTVTPFAKSVFTATTSGVYDIGAFVYNSTITSLKVGFAIYAGNLDDSSIAANISGTFISDSSFPGAYIYAVSLTQGQQYTFVASNVGSSPANTYVSFFVRPTAVKQLGAAIPLTEVFTSPNSQSYGSESDCTPTSDESMGYLKVQFKSQGSVVYVAFIGGSYRINLNEDSATPITGNYMAAYLYDYDNTVPQACPNVGGGYVMGVRSDNTVYNLDADYDEEHTIVFTQYSTSYPNGGDSGYDGRFISYIFNGPTIGETPVTPTGTPIPTNTPAPNGTGTPAPNPTNSPVVPTTPADDSSSACQLIASISAIFLVVVALL